MHGRYGGEVALLAIVLMWGFGYTANRYAVTHGWQPLALPAVRFMCAATVFAAIVLKLEGTLRIARRDLPRVVAAALVLALVNNPSFHYSVKFASASTVALVFGTMPIFAALVSQLLGHERLRRRHWIATTVSFGGVALVAAGTSGTLDASIGGIGLALLAAASFATYSVLIATLSGRYSPWRISAVIMLIGVGPLTAIASPQLARTDFGALSGMSWAAASYTFFMFTSTTVLWYLAIRRVGPAHAALWANMQPFAGVMFGVLILSESLVGLEIVGAVIIAASIVMSRWRRVDAPIVE